MERRLKVQALSFSLDKHALWSAVNHTHDKSLACFLTTSVSNNRIFCLEIAGERNFNEGYSSDSDDLIVWLEKPEVAEHNDDPTLPKIPNPIPSTSQGIRQYVCHAYTR